MGNAHRPFFEDGPRNVTVAVRPLSRALGAEIAGLDADALASPALDELLHRAVLEHQVVLIRGLDLDPPSFRRLAARLGPLRPVPEDQRAEPGFTDVQRLSNVGADGAATGRHPDPYSRHWHTDGSVARIPPRCTLLYAIRATVRDGETSFADMYAAFAALPQARRQALAGRLAVHDIVVSRYLHHGAALAPARAGLAQQLRAYGYLVRRMLSRSAVRHPVIREHEETARPCLYLGDHAWRVTGCGWRAGARLVDELNTFATTGAWTYTHSWRTGDLLIWDNRCVLHRSLDYDTAGDERVMLRAVVMGTTTPIAARVTS